MTNKEKHIGEDLDELMSNLADELCNQEYCPYMRGEGSHAPGSTCEGSHCVKAFNEWLESEVKQ